MSQRLGACGSVASGALRSFLSATYGTPCEKTFHVLRYGVLEEMCDGGSVKKEINKIN